MNWVTLVEWLARIIFFLLFILSFVSLAIIIDRYRFYKLLQLPEKKFQDLILSKDWEKLKMGIKEDQGLLGNLLQELSLHDSENYIDRAFSSFMVREKRKLDQGLAILGTLGPTAPFIGLLGTVLGIIVSFAHLSEGLTNSHTVMFSLAEALVLTAAGLMVAIPSVVAFNYFSRKSKNVLLDVNALKDFYIAHLKPGNSHGGK